MVVSFCGDAENATTKYEHIKYYIKPYTMLTNKNESENSVEHSSHYTLIIIAFAWSTITATLNYPLTKLFEQSTIVVFRNHEKKPSYEFQRLFAPIGFAVDVFLSGAAVDIYSKTPYYTKYNASFFSCLRFGVLFFIFSVLLPRPV